CVTRILASGLYPRVGFIVTNLARPTERIVASYNQRAMTEQWIREGKGAIKRTPNIRYQCRPPPTPCARVQPRQFHAHAGDAEDGAAMVADQPAREADQDRREGRRPRPLRDLPDGRGRRVTAHVQRHPDAYCPASRAAHSSVRDARIECDKRRR